MNLFDKVQQTVEFLKQNISFVPEIGIILGSGLGGLVGMVEKESEVVIDYHDIPNFPVSTVVGHGGKLVCGKINGHHVILLSGRFHYYEGYEMAEVTFPVRVMQAIGAHTLILSNAAGGTNPGFNIGDLMIIKDHINLFPENPLRGPNDDRLGPRFPDMGQAYDPYLVELARSIASELKIDVRTGVYIGLQGPTFETPAEYRWLYGMGGDAVGMSTVPEVIVARHMGMKVFALSVITDIGISDTPVTVSHEEVLEAANAAAPKMAAMVASLIAKLVV